MTIRESLIALKTEIRQNFPKVDRSQSNNKIQAIQIMQELLAEVLLQIERVLEQVSLPEEFKDGNDEQKKVLASLAQFCMAISLTGKNRLFAGTFFVPLLDKKSYDSLNSTLKSIYAAITYLDPRIKLLDADFEEGSSMLFPCHDLKMNLHRSFKSSLTIRMAGDATYFDEIQEIIKELDDNYQNDNYCLAESQPPLHPPVKEKPNLSSTSKFDPETDSLFAGKFLAQPSSSTKTSSRNLSFSDSPKNRVEEPLEKPTKRNGSTKNTVSFIIIRNGSLWSNPPEQKYIIKENGSQLFLKPVFPKKYTTPPPVISKKITP